LRKSYGRFKKRLLITSPTTKPITIRHSVMIHRNMSFIVDLIAFPSELITSIKNSIISISESYRKNDIISTVSISDSLHCYIN